MGKRLTKSFISKIKNSTSDSERAYLEIDIGCAEEEGKLTVEEAADLCYLLGEVNGTSGDISSKECFDEVLQNY